MAMPGVTRPSSPDDTLRSRVGQGVRWSLANTVLSRVVSLGAGILLARILDPKDYGVYAVAMVVLTALLSMNELGVSLAVVRWPGDVGRIAPTVASLAVGVSALLYVLAYALAPAFASTLNAPGAAPMIRLLSVCILVDAVAAVPAGLITREFQQRRRLVIDLAGFASGTALTIVLALLGHGAWSLLWGFVVSNVIVGAMCVALAPTWYGFGFDAGVARDLLAFGLPLAGSSGVLFLLMNLDYVVVGRLLGATSLGFYLLAFNVCSWPVNLISTAMRRVTLAGFSRAAESPEGAGAAFRKAVVMVLTVALPMAVLLGVFAEPLVVTAYGDKWAPSADPLRFLAILAVTRILVDLLYDFLVAVGRNPANLILQSLWLLAALPALIVGARLMDITGVAIGHAVVAVVVIGPAMVLIVHRCGIPVTQLGRDCARPLLGAVVMAVVGAGVIHSDWNSWLVMLGGGALCSAAYVLVVWPVLRDLRATVAGGLGSRCGGAD